MSACEMHIVISSHTNAQTQAYSTGICKLMSSQEIQRQTSGGWRMPVELSRGEVVGMSVCILAYICTWYVHWLQL